MVSLGETSWVMSERRNAAQQMGRYDRRLPRESVILLTEGRQAMNLWMRWLDFRALRDLLLLVDRHRGGLRANELERLATKERVLLRRDGQPAARTTHYNHRRTLERLELLQKQDRHFALGQRNAEICALTAHQNLREQLQPSEKVAFANAVLQNKDCYEAFFGHFLPGRASVCDVATFVEQAHPVELVVNAPVRQEAGLSGARQHHRGRSRSRSVAIRPADTSGDWCVLDSPDALQAIHFGLRSWCVGQLGFMDTTYAASGVYTVYPKHIVARLTDQELAARMFAAIEFVDDWATIRIPDHALATGIEQHVSVEQAKAVLMKWLTAHPGLVAGVPTRVGFITAGLPDRLHRLALNGYLRSNSGAYLSHLRIHRRLREDAQIGDPTP